MEKIEEMTKTVNGKFATFMTGKPMWAFWTLYTLISGILFGVLYFLFRIVSQQWWIAVITIVAAGILWGTSNYTVMRAMRTSKGNL